MLLLLGMAYAFGTTFGVLSATWFFAWAAAALIINAAAFLMGPRLMTAAYGVQVVAPEQAPRLHRIVEEVAQAAGVPKPRVGLISDKSLNAFAMGTGPRHALMACTVGLVDGLDDEELKGVIAHELSHVAHRDTLVMTSVATVAAFFAYAVPIAVLTAAGLRRMSRLRAVLVAAAAFAGGMFAVTIVRSFVGRKREYYADADAARLSGSPHGLASALRKIEAAQNTLTMEGGREASAHIFFANPLDNDRWRQLFETHPPIQARIARLEAGRT